MKNYERSVAPDYRVAGCANNVMAGLLRVAKDRIILTIKVQVIQVGGAYIGRGNTELTGESEDLDLLFDKRPVPAARAVIEAVAARLYYSFLTSLDSGRIVPDTAPNSVIEGQPDGTFKWVKC